MCISNTRAPTPLSKIHTHTHLILSTSRIKKSFFLTGRTNDRISISSEAMNTNNYDVVIETMHIKQVELTKSRHDPSYCSHKTVFTLLHNFGVRCLFNMISQTLPIHSMYMYVFRNSNAQNKHDTFWATEKNPVYRTYEHMQNKLFKSLNKCLDTRLKSWAKFLHLDVFK